MIAERDYLHLEEADRIPGLNKFDLIEMFHKNQIKLYCWCSASRLFAEGSYKGDEKPSILGSFSYTGAVGIQKDKINDLLTKNKLIKIRRFVIKQPEEVRSWSDSIPLKLDLPNETYLQYKHCKAPDFDFWAFINVTTASKTQAASSISNIFNSFIASRTDDFDAESHEQLNQSKKDFKRLFDQKVSYDTKEFYPADLRFCKSEILKLVQPEIASLPAPISRPKAPNALDEVIITILENNPGRSDHVWNILRIESKKEIFDRSYDIDGILEEVSQTLITWRDERNRKKRELSRESYKNKLSKLRKKL
ncbi:hypothetical protein [Thiomicrorhabdus arctica]|uniref:hypothetical protein n=1 Tax=Thiomicrorhabdus arctica TaxID=131540 RepID=UPI00035CDB3D|nr:hypothetical protein [Thiomicrorhabdus arctica]